MVSLSPSSYSPDRGPVAKVTRRLTQWRTALPLTIAPDRPIVCFTFDDFPKSAAIAGARILEQAGGHGTYYACTGMSGTRNETGELFDESDIRRLVAAGHEIGAHTQSHIDCALTPLADAVADIEENLERLERMGAPVPITQFAYPYGETTVALKRHLIGRFDSVRGILPGTNTTKSDLMQLRAYELDGSTARTDRALAAIRSLNQSPGWIVLFTHDVGEQSSGFGVSEATLANLVAEAVDAGASLLTMSEALRAVRGAPA
ncbi:MAG TPA: polysaccharide deacetylase family protein [Hyphomonas sp.]|nr:polysaccharide deacetylase family protein [Hyphomonas sp.]MCB9961303.1 polysaccharide deacetylase family protein [Hyphomonas sp.]MCB9971478.1 polysaccharide deacetylase family protein [Hyphomonas sp.]HPE47057.1 polysaccharide deacetylase family protein [Hyphomonas sp.]